MVISSRTLTKECEVRKLSVLFVVAVAVICGGIAGQTLMYLYQVKPLEARIASAEAELKLAHLIQNSDPAGATFDYGEYEGLPVQLVIESGGRVILQMPYGNDPAVTADLRGDYLEYLKVQVQNAHDWGVDLRNGMHLRVVGFPIWGPGEAFKGPSRRVKQLYFGDMAVFNGTTLTVQGEGQKPVGFYPYILAPRSHPS